MNTPNPVIKNKSTPKGVLEQGKEQKESKGWNKTEEHEIKYTILYARIQETSCSILRKKQTYLETTYKLISLKNYLDWPGLKGMYCHVDRKTAHLIVYKKK